MYTNPIAPDNYIYPPYLWPQVVAVLEAQGLPYLPSMAPIFAPNDPFAAFHYSDGRHSLNGQRGIEMPWQTGLDSYTANVLILHEIGMATPGRRKRFCSAWKREVDAWEQAREIRDNIEFPKADPATGETWSTVEDLFLISHASLKILREDLTPIADQCKTSAKSAATIQPAVFLLMLIAAKEISLSLVLAFLGLFAGLEIITLLGTIAFSEQANKVLSKWHGRRFWDEIEPDEQPPEDGYSEIQTANTHPEK